MAFEYNLVNLDEPSLLNILIDEFNERGYTIVLRGRDHFEVQGRHSANIMIDGNTIKLGACTKCDMYNPDSFKIFMQWVSICLEQPCCPKCIFGGLERSDR